MPYIGNTPALDYISFAVQNFTVTAGTTVYTLDYSVSNENDIALYINSVAQRPGASFAYSATGTTLTLTSATLATDTMYAVFIGRAVQTVTPPASSITNTMLSPSVITGQTAITVPATDDVLLCYDTSATALRKITFADFGNTPAFSAYRATSNQSIPNNADTTIQYNAELFDTDSCFNTSTYKFIPNVSGKYFINASILLNGGSNSTRFEFYIVKNGTVVKAFRQQGADGNPFSIKICGIVEANGTTDEITIQFYAFTGSLEVVFSASGVVSFFEGYRLIGV
jgi:hypothetical protein